MQQIVLEYFDLYILLFKTIKHDTKTAERIVNNLENIFALYVRPLRQDRKYLNITNLCQNIHFTY